MEAYVLDSLLRRTEVIDLYESFIWTERFSDVGDFELKLKSTPGNRGLLTAGTQLAINNSYRVMTVETVEDTTTEDGKEVLNVKGYSLEDVLGDRVAKNTMSNLVTEPDWIITDTPGNVARTMFNHICRSGALDILDIIPFIQPGSIFAPSTIPESTTDIVWTQAPDSLYTAIKAVCDAYDLGFRLVRNFDTSQLYFDVYSGNDRTSRQTVLTPVIFSPNIDNLQNTTEYSTIQGSKNVAYVFANAGFAIVFGEGVDTEIDGFERRVLTVNAQVEVGNPDVSGALTQAGEEALRGVRSLSYFDGETNQNSEYTYGVDYDLGDLVELRNKDGIVTYKRVTEQIFVCDVAGERSYPTLTMDASTGADTWLSWNSDTKAWADFTTEFWQDM